MYKKIKDTGTGYSNICSYAEEVTDGDGIIKVIRLRTMQLFYNIHMFHLANRE